MGGSYPFSYPYVRDTFIFDSHTDVIISNFYIQVTAALGDIENEYM